MYLQEFEKLRTRSSPLRQAAEAAEQHAGENPFEEYLGRARPKEEDYNLVTRRLKKQPPAHRVGLGKDLSSGLVPPPATDTS
mmetsp:Transcript_67340/g.219360  ORF Transcript_67340/g.219360 Transcript_67340/m.219360 type:complete len:82 (-) Transcript_67340:488-733(-)